MMEIRTFWDIAPCRLVGIDDVSVVRTASMIRVMSQKDLIF
jgi:hypothetical protein